MVSMKKSFGALALAYTTPVWVIGTYGKDGRPNAATVAWGGICSSQPPALAISLRKSRYSYENIQERRAFTVNVPSADQIAIADYCGIVSGRNGNKFEAAHITAEKAEIVDAPYIKEFPMVIECRLADETEIGVHMHLIGEILDVKVDDSLLAADGLPDILKVNPVLYAPESRDYYAVGRKLGKAFAIGKDLK